MKNLTTTTETKTVVVERAPISPDLAVQIVQFSLALKNKGRSPESIRTYTGALTTLANKGANLLDPSNVEHIIAKQDEWSLRAKKNYVDWYARFAKFKRFEWEKPTYKAPKKEIIPPPEALIDQFIAGSPRLVSIAYQIGKETATRIGEVVRIQWDDLDTNNKLLAINYPEKGSNTNTYTISESLLLRLNGLPHKTKRILGTATADSIGNMSLTARKALTKSFNNPEFMKLHFHILRHWKLTNLAIETLNPFKVQEFGRHHNVEITMDYIHLAEKIIQKHDSGKWIIKAVTTPEEVLEFGELGYTPYMMFKGVQYVRKQK